MARIELGDQTLRDVVLHGELARKYGKHHRFVVSSAAEAVRALSANFKGFAQHLAESQERGIAYQVWVNGRNQGERELKMNSAGRIYISPVVMGSKRAGTFQTILGAVLIVVGAVGAFTPWGEAFGGGAWGPPLIAAGVAMTAGGIAQMLAPVPKQDGSNQVKSSFFDGPINIASQGAPVPLWYGKGIVGSVVISGGIKIADSGVSSGGSGTSGGGGDRGRRQYYAQ